MFKVVDTETTKLQGDVIEIASVLIDEYGVPLKKPVNHLVYSDQTIEFSAMGVHGITPEMLVGAPLLENIIKDHEVGENGYIVGHNVAYDVGVLPDEFSEGRKVLCTMRLAKKLYTKAEVGDFKNMTLFYALGCYKDFQYEGSAHRADYDVMVTASVLEKVLEEHDMDIHMAYEMLDQPDKKEDVGKTICNFKKHKGKLWEQVVTDDRDYCVWLLNNFNWKSDNDPVKEWLSKNL